MSKLKITNILVPVLTLVAAIAAWLLLPDHVALQITGNGSAGNMVERPVAVLLPVVISIGALIMMNLRKETGKLLILAWFGIVLQAAVILINRLSHF